ncbi:MAG: CAP domain-containing protein [Candidatus Angelobacter sp.]
MMKRHILAVLLMFPGLAAHPQNSASPMEKQLFDLVNRERQRAGLEKFEWNDRLASGALAHSKLLAEQKTLSHQFAGEPLLQERLGATGARFNSVAENVAEAPEVESAHQGLMHSPGHRENILNPNYNAVGISIVQRGDELYVTQDFAHILASYTEKQIGDAVVAGFNRTRRARHLPAINVVMDARMKKAACAQDMNTDKMIQNLPGAARLLVFSLSEPGALPDGLGTAAADQTMERMSIGVCLQTGGKNGFSKFWVVAAFYRTASGQSDSTDDAPPLQ